MRLPTRSFDVVLAILVSTLGVMAFSDLAFVVLFMPLAYAVLFRAFFTARRQCKDWLNPLCILLVVGFVRFSLPGLLLLAGVDPDIQTFRLMRLRDADWLLGHSLALLGLLGLVIGWLLVSRRSALGLGHLVGWRGPSTIRGLRSSAGLGMLAGLGGLVLFVASNSSLGAILSTGEFRGTAIQVGTGKFFYLSLLLIASSVVLTGALAAREPRVGWRTFLPVMFALIAFWPLGGRVRALVPCAAALLILWYRRHDLEPSFRRALLIAALASPILLYAGSVYRSGGGLEGVLQGFSVAPIVDYAKYAIWVDWGQLHALAGAVGIGPGTLDGRAFFTFLWPFSEIYDLGGRSAGVYIAEVYVGFVGSSRWGFHASLMGDGYLHYGVGVVLLMAILLGMLLKVLYVTMREGRMNIAFYALAIMYTLRVFFESIERYPEALVVLLFVVLVARADRFLRVSLRSRGGVVPRPALVSSRGLS